MTLDYTLGSLFSYLFICYQSVSLFIYLVAGPRVVQGDLEFLNLTPELHKYWTFLMAWNSVCRPRWRVKHKESLYCASVVLELNVCSDWISACF